MFSVSVKILAIILLLCCSAFFSCSETAFFSLSRVQIKRLRESKGLFIKRALAILKRPREILITILMGNEVVNIAIAVIVASIVYRFSGSIGWKWSTIVSVLISTPLVLMFGEVLPKNIAINFAGQIAPVLSVPLSWFYWAMTPLRIVLAGLADAFVKLFGGDPKQIRSMIMEEEVRQIVDMGCEEGAIHEPEADLIHAVFDFSDMMAKDVMTSIDSVFRLPLNVSFSKLLEEIKEAQFSRIPIYQDEPNDIVGILYVRDFLSFYKGQKSGHAKDLEEIIRPALYVEDSIKLEELLQEFRERKVHMAIVVDDDRRPVGIVTMDDVLGALFGEEGL